MPSGRASVGTTWDSLWWVNGRRIDPHLPALSVFDRGFTLGDGCFETMRAYSGMIFRLEAHLTRLADAADRLGIPVPPHLDETVADAVRVVRAARADATVRLTLSRGAGPGLAPPRGTPPTTVLSVVHLPTPPLGPAPRGLTVRVGRGRRNEYAVTAGLKTLSYTDAVVELAAARAQGADDALLLDTEGHLSEASSSNIFLVIRGVVHTPPLSCGVLPGITRAAVLEILDRLDIPCENTPLAVEALDAADEMFLTSSVREIAPVVLVNDAAIGTGSVGPLTALVRDRYAALVAECVADAASDRASRDPMVPDA